MLAASPRFPTLTHAVKVLSRIAVRHEAIAERYRFIGDLRLPSGVQTLYLSGYWQAHQYADAIAPQLRRQLRLREPATGHNLKMLKKIAEAPVSVSLHMRRGDYTLAAEGNIALPLDYYQRAIQNIRQRFDNPVFFIFSDDIGFARKNLPTEIRQVFAEGNDDFSSYEDLRLMAACQHHIIANSSFSWWGAWLNSNPEKMVIAPRHWLLTRESEYPDLLPPTWNAIDSLRDSHP